jgi:phosphatidylserine/phosphatidylglycerophosphate/cardiolipin synthase-like enzyme
MKLVVQPDDGLVAIVTAIKQARKTIDIVIFRLDLQDVTRALEAAAARGVLVRALIAHTNRGGEKRLRKLEMRLLEKGITVSRSADDLVRYHGKMMIVDRRILHVYGFNFTGLDVGRSRSFGAATRNHKLVREAITLFEADCARVPYTPGCERFVVSPENSRECLTAFIKGARKQLLIYDPQVSDPGILRLLAERARAGVDVRIIGKIASKKSALVAEKYPGKRLHVRAMIRDARRAFLGSQSLRKLELERRREIGVIVTDPKAANQMRAVFEEDWAQTGSGRAAAKGAERDLEHRDHDSEPAATT